MTSNRILILEKNRLEFLLLKERLLEVGFAPNHLLHGTSLADMAGPEMTDAAPSFIFVDLFLNDSTGLATFQRVHKAFPGVPIVVLTDATEKEMALHCIHLGAQDYLVKGEFSLQLLNKTIRFATERNAYRLEMEKLKSDYQNLFRKNPMPMWVFDFATLRFLSVNKAAEEKYGYTEDEFCSLTLEDIHPKEDLAALRALLQTATPGDTMSSRGIWRHIKKNGQIIQVEIFSAPVMYKDRQAAIGSSIDVTEKMLAEQTEIEIRQELEAKSHHIEQILESISDAVFVLDRDWSIKYWNQATEALYGIPRQQAIGHNIWDKFPNGKATVGVAYQRALQHQKTEHFEYYSPVTQKWMSISVYPTQDEGLTVYIKDLTEEKRRTYEAIEESNNFQALIDNTSDSIWSINTNLEVIAANKAFKSRVETYYDKPLAKGTAVIGANVPEEEAAKWRERYATALAGQPLRVDEAIRLFSNEVILVEMHFNPIRNREGAIIGVACQAHHIKGEA